MQWGTKDGMPAAFARIQLRTAEIHSQINTLLRDAERRPKDIERVIKLVARARALDQEFVDTHAAIPNWWKFKTVAYADPVDDQYLDNLEAFPGRVDKYPDVSIATASVSLASHIQYRTGKTGLS
jgi:hypothetical protein